MTIRVGIGGWTYEPWRGSFYPKGLPQARELEFASRAMTAIEVNATFYRTMTPDAFRHWAEQAPDGFVFALKAPRYATNRRALREAGQSIARFIGSGIEELGDKLGPINWQFAPTKAFDADDLAGFLDLLPRDLNGYPLRHVLEVRHASFRCARFIRLMREAGVAVVVADSPHYPLVADITADFIYVRLQDARAEEATGYSPAALDLWAARARAWNAGAAAEGLAPCGDGPALVVPRDTFIFFINGAKERAPAAAQALLARLD